MQISSSGGGNAVAQMQQMRARMFAQADSDKSGGLSVDEFKTMGPQGGRPPDGAAAGGRPPGGPPPGGAPDAAPSAGGAAKAAGTAASASVQDLFNSLDTDGDGSLNQAELEAGRPDQGRRGQGAIGAEGMPALLNAQEQSGGDTGVSNEAAMARAVEAMLRRIAAMGGSNSGFSATTA